MKRERNMCLSCPGCFKPLVDGLVVTANGWENKIIDGREMTCCRPGYAHGSKKTMDRFDFYCLAMPKGKKIAKGADYTGNTPLWCPRLEAKKMTTEKRLIDSNEALRMMRNSKLDNPYSGTLCGTAWNVAHDCAISCVEAESCTVDAVEVVHGRWLTLEEYAEKISADPTGYAGGWRFCSECEQPMRELYGWAYCPNCGAKMDGGNGDD